MIQRKQTLFFIFAFLSHLILIFLPIGSFEILDQTGNVSDLLVFGPIYKNALEGIILPETRMFIYLNFFGMFFSMAGIFAYKRRNLQLRLAVYGIVSAVLYLITAGFMINTFVNNAYFIWIPIKSLTLTPAVFNVVWLILAIKFIKKDIALMASLNRIR
jgi:hypothetical protein